MTDPVLEVPHRRSTCDNCKFGERQEKDLSKIVCFGVPPTPVLVAAQPDRFGRPNFQFLNQRPMVDPGTPACSLYQFEIKAALSAK